MGAAAAGLRLLLRQAALRPHRSTRDPPDGVREHLQRRPGLPVAAAAVPGEPRRAPHRLAGSRATLERAAAVAIATLPGRDAVARRAVRGPPRPPAGLPSPAARRAARPGPRRLVPAAPARRSPSARCGRGRWQLLEATGWPDNQSCRNLLAWSWSRATTPATPPAPRRGQPLRPPAQGQVRLPWPDLPADAGTCRPALGRRVRPGRRRARRPRVCTSICSRGSTTCWQVR